MHPLEYTLRKQADPIRSKTLSRFFKTGPGEYGEGQQFLGITMPHIRSVASQFTLSLKEIETFLCSPLHELKTAALLILIRLYRHAEPQNKKEIVDFYLSHTDQLTNWDFVDLTAYQILGDYCLTKQDPSPLFKLAHSDNLWKNRVAIVATFAFIKRDQLKHTLDIAQLLLPHSHDLIHKAVGWMLRELGKKDRPLLEHFLQTYYSRIPRTTLRYAIERFPEPTRKAYLKGTF